MSISKESRPFLSGAVEATFERVESELEEINRLKRQLQILSFDLLQERGKQKVRLERDERLKTSVFSRSLYWEEEGLVIKTAFFRNIKQIPNVYFGMKKGRTTLVVGKEDLPYFMACGVEEEFSKKKISIRPASREEIIPLINLLRVFKEKDGGN